MKKIVIGILGGMGTYATINMFQQYAEVFPAEKEWDRPRIIIDNRCTMPSRVRAFLYKENIDKLSNEMEESLVNLSDMGCNKIILACNTSHLFLKDICDKHPELTDKIVHIINNCVDEISIKGLHSIFLLGSEGTIDSKIYQDRLQTKNIECITPSKDEYERLRYCIEAVKQNKYDDKVKDIFVDLMNRYNSCILGCTELPVLYDKYKEFIECKNVFDPLYLALLKLKEDFDND